MDDQILFECNETELLTIARQAGLGRLRRGLPKEELVAIVSGWAFPRADQMSGTGLTRQSLEATIKANLEVMRSQLPGCNGRCTIYHCSDSRHAVCYSPNESSIRP